VIIITIGNQILIQKILNEKQGDASIINLAGKQRMLSQKIAKQVYQSEFEDISLKELNEDLENWNRVHNGLQQGDSNLNIEGNRDEDISTLFEVLDVHHKAIKEVLNEIENPDQVQQAIPVVKANEQEFLAKMDEIVNLFESKSKESIQRLIYLEIVLAIFSILVLVGEFYFIFRPLLNRLELDKEQLAKNLKKLSKSKGALLESAQRFELSLKAINAGIWDWYLEDNSEWWSPRFYEMLGYKDGEIDASYNTFLNILLHREDKEKVVKAVEKHLEVGEPYRLEIRMKNKSGDYHWFETVGQASFDIHGKPIRMVGSIINIDEKHAATDEKERVEKIFKSVFNSTFSFMGLLEKDGTIIEINKPALEFSGQTLEGVKGILLEEAVWWPTEKEKELAKKAVRTASKGNLARLDLDVVGKDGQVLKLDFSINPIFDNEGNVLYLIPEGRDISERVEIYKELISTKETLEEGQRAAKMGTWQVDLQKMMTNWSDEVYRIHEVEPGTQINVEEGINFYREDYRPVIQKVIDEAIAENKSWDVECVLVTKKGNEIWVRAIGYPVFENKELIGLRGLFMDIDAKKRAENEKRKAELIFRSIFDSTFNFTGLLKPDGTLIEANKSALDFGGFTMDQARGLKFYDAPWWSISEEIRDQLKEAIKKAAKGEFIRYDVDVVGAEKDVITIDFSITPIFNDQNEVIYLVPEGRNISEKIELTKQLELGEQQLRSFVKQAPVAVAMVDKEMNYIAASQQWNEEYNLGDKDLVGQNHYEVFPEINALEEWKDAHKRVLRGDSLENPRDKFLRADGSIQWITWKLIPWYKEPGEIGGMIMYTADITDEVAYTEKLEKEVNKRTQELKVANDELESFSYSISHDLRAPLRSIHGFSDILIEDYSDKVDENGVRLLGIVKDSATRMGNLIDDMLQFSRLGRASIESSSINMNSLFETVIEDLKPLFIENKSSIVVEDLASASGDISLIKQVVTNLLANALKYSSTNEKISVNVTSRIENKQVCYSVKDNGVGFNMEYHDKIFGVFQRLHSDNEFEGTGVGLAIVKRIVNMHGGEVWAESEFGEGSIFYFTLPLADKGS
jgi:PAS domain S-box-containing protein